MLFNFFLTAVFLASAAGLWYIISLKIPELVAVSDSVIVERLHEDSARVRIFLLHFKTFYREGRYRIWFWKFYGKVLYRVHIFLLRWDNTVVRVLQKIRVTGGAENDTPEKVVSISEEYWLQLRRDPEVSASGVKKTVSPGTSRRMPSRMSEVRLKNKGIPARQAVHE